MKKLEKKQLWIGIAAAVLLAAFALLLYRPLHNRIQELRAAKAALAQAETAAIARQKRLPELRKELAQAKSQVGTFENRIPADRQLGQLLQNIAEAMNRHGLKDQLVAPDAEKQAEKLNCIPVRMQCSGSMKQIFEFFGSIEGLERVIRIDQVQLRNTAELSGVVTMNAVANVYYQSQGQGK